MTKRKSKRRQKRKDKLHIPHTVEEAQKDFMLQFKRALRTATKKHNATRTKTNAEQSEQEQIKESEQEQIKELAGAIYEYMAEKDLTKPGRSWQDFLLFSRLQRIYLQTSAKEIVKKTGEDERMAELKLIYENLPSAISASKKEMDKIISTLENQKPKHEITYQDILIEIAKLRGVSIDIDALKNRNLLDEVYRIVDSVVKKHEQNKWIMLIEGILIGLFSNGLFDLLKWSIKSLVMRAPYTEAQIYEVECDVLRAFYEWRPARKYTAGFKQQDVSIAHLYVLHAVCVLSVLGGTVPRNLLHWMIYADDATQQLIQPDRP